MKAMDLDTLLNDQQCQIDRAGKLHIALQEMCKALLEMPTALLQEKRSAKLMQLNDRMQNSDREFFYLQSWRTVLCRITVVKLLFNLL